MVRILSLLFVAFGLLVQTSGPVAQSCPGLRVPVEGPLVRGFQPVGRFSGHWGVDWTTPVGTGVRSAGAGVVTFAGTVASNRTVTIHHGGGLRTSYSYLSDLRVEQGDQVGSATLLGSSGDGHGTSALHFSVRIGDTYVDPELFLTCTKLDPARALRLVAARETS